MVIILYVLSDLCLSFLCSLVVFVVAIGIVFRFKTQFLFLLCLPYFVGVGNTNLLVNNFGVFTELYFLLLGWLFFLIFPYFVFIICFYLAKPYYRFLFFRNLLFISRTFFCLFLVAVYASFWVTVPFFFALISLAIPARSHAISFVLDFTPDSWLHLFLVLVCLSTIFLLMYSAFLFRISSLLFRSIFLFRLTLFAVFFFFLTTFIPYDTVLHASLLIIYLFMVELPIFFRCFLVNYGGRVA